MPALLPPLDAALREIPLPLDVARHYATSANWVWLDSSQVQGDGLSLIAVEPSAILRVLPEDQGLLREVLTRHARPSSGRGIPQGGLFGQVGFDGQFLFGVFEDCHVFQHRSATWLTPPLELEKRPPPHLEYPALAFAALTSQADFVSMVRQAQEYIAAGDIYQVNLSFPWLARWPKHASPWAFYESLRRHSPSPYGAFLALDGECVCSASPECFLKISQDRILTRPIKGTRPRHAARDKDEALADELLHSAKERSELVMITDLERNDLGQVCEFGSVHVTDLLKLERFAQVQHLVSTVEGRLHKEIDHLDAFLACFPGGSISGAPKKRALEIIHELESHERGLYTGAIGYFGFNGESQFNIAIRTAWLDGENLRFHTGAGIVADSDPVSEYDETVHKAQGLLMAARLG